MTVQYGLMRGDLVTPRVAAWLRTFRAARVLHLSDGACNLVDDRGEVISLVGPRVGPGPFAIVLSGELPAGLPAEMAVSYDAARRALAVGPVNIDLRRAGAWQPIPRWSRLRHVDPAAWPPSEALPPELCDPLERMLHGIIVGDEAGCRVGAIGLVGRGPGLTPAGDDVLVGVLFALWVWRPASEWTELIRDATVPRTTTLSAAFIRAAAAGEAVEPWHRLANGETDAVAGILSIGHTSGADAWAGFYHAGAALAPPARKVSGGGDE